MFKKFIFLLSVFVLIRCSNSPEQKSIVVTTQAADLIPPPADTSKSKNLIGENSNLNTFIPKGFLILDSLGGDLNLDAYNDLVLILKMEGEDSLQDVCRPLLILTGQENKSYKLEARNDSVVLCRSCGGVFGDPYESTVIKNGYFSIQHYGGSNWRWTRIITFKFVKEKNSWVLHRDAGESYHTSNPDKTEKIVTNKEDFDKLPVEKFNCMKNF
jgi:hypothetical protein